MSMENSYLTNALRVALLVSLGVQAPEQASAQGGGRVWSFESDGSWLADDASLGNRGTEVFTNLGSYVNRRGLLSGHDQDPPAPVWTDERVGLNYTQRSASAGLADLHVTLQAEYPTPSSSSLTPVVRAYRGSSSQVLWQHDQGFTVFGLQYMDVFCSRDGERVVTLVGASSGARMTVYGPSSATPLLSVQLATFGAPLRAALSADGSTLLVGNSLTVQAFDVASGVALHQHFPPSGSFAGALDLSSDGDRLVLAGTFGIQAYQRGAAGYSLLGTRSLLAGEVPQQVACSDDGSVVALGAGFPALGNVVGVRTLDWDSGADLAGWRSGGQGGPQNRVTALDVSAGGEAAVAGFAGDGGVTPEVCVLRPGGSTGAVTHALAGSVRTVELAPDGSRFVVASLGAHLTAGATGGAITLYDTLEHDLLVEGVPVQGSTVELVHATGPGKPVLFLRSSGLAATPRVLGPAGLLHLDEGTLELVSGLVLADGEGMARKPLQLVGLASQLGTTRHYQAIGLRPRRLSESVATVTILP